MLYNQIINNSVSGWKHVKKVIDKSNNLIDFRHNVSIQKPDTKIEQLADNVMNVQMNSMFNFNIESYKERLKMYNIMYKYPEINRAINTHVNEVLITDEDGEFIDFKFTALGENNIPENIKLDINNLALGLFKSGYSLTKLRRDLITFFVEGMLVYEMVTDENNNITLRRLFNGSYYTFVWNNKPLYVIELTNVEQLTDTDLSALKSDINSTIEMEMNNKFTMDGFKNACNSYNSVAKIHPIEKLLYMRWYENLSEETNETISFLEHTAPVYNRLATMEAHLVAYRVSRAITTYAINLDLGDMPYQEKEVMLNRYMDEYDTETIYNPVADATTNIKDAQTVRSIYWFTKGGKFGESTVDPIDFKATFSEIDDVRYFASQVCMNMKLPLARMGAITGNEKMEQQRNNSLDGQGMLQEEIDYQKFLDNVRVTLTDDVIRKWLQTVLTFKGLEPVIINANNFKIRLHEDNKYKLYMKKIDLDIKMEMVNTMAPISSTESLYKNYLGLSQTEWIGEITKKLEEKEVGLDILFSEGDERLTLEQIDAIRNKYIIGDKEYKITTQRENNLYDNINEKYNRRENKLKLYAFINYFENIIKINAMDMDDLYKSANDKVIAKK